MRKMIVNEWMRLDGVMQAPGAPDEDTTGGFRHGGGTLGYFDDISREWTVKNLTEAGGLLFGRRTYGGFAGHWPDASEDDGALRALQLVNSQAVTTGAILATYEWARI